MDNHPDLPSVGDENTSSAADMPSNRGNRPSCYHPSINITSRQMASSSSNKDPHHIQVTVSTRKRHANGQENCAVAEKKSNHDLVVQVNKNWFQPTVVNQFADLSYNESEIYQYESLDDKRTKTEAEFAALGIPIMTMIGPSSGTVLPKRGVYRYYEYDHANLPIRMIDNVETIQNGGVVPVIEQYDVLPDYQIWYRYALTSLFPDTRVEPRVLETVYGAWAKICEWANEGSVQRNRAI